MDDDARERRAQEDGARERQLRARCIAVAIYPELLRIQVELDRAEQAVKNWLPPDAQGGAGMFVANLQFNAHIQLPPLLDRSVESLWSLGAEAGPSTLQFVSVLVQYNSLLTNAVQQMAPMSVNDACSHSGALEGHLKALRNALEGAIQGVSAVHDAGSATSMEAADGLPALR